MNFSWKIAYFIILSGFFVVFAFLAVNYQNLSTAFYIFIGSVCSFIFLFGVFVGQSSARSLTEVTSVAHKLSEGDLHSRAHVKSNDEFNRLAEALNAMADELEKNKNEKEKMNEMVAVKVNSIVRPVHDTIEALEQKVAHRTAQMHWANNLSKRAQLDVMLKEAEFIDLKGKLAKVMKRKSKKITRQDA